MNAGEPRRGAELDAGDGGRGGAQHGELRRDQPAGQVSHVPRVTCNVCYVVTCNECNVVTWQEHRDVDREGPELL